MHKEFRELLEHAKGVSELIVAVFIDVRGFSSFSKNTDSLAVGLFVKHMYKRIIETYFSNPTFFKPTGDGLLVVLEYDESNVKDVVASTITTCCKIVGDFSTFFKDEPVVNFIVPDRIGIGVARGPATRLSSEDKTLDYSGHVLNLAARIMDLARPTGVVLDSGVIAGIEDLPDSFQKNFVKESGYLRGVAEDEQVTVYYDKSLTKLPESYKIPFGVLWKSLQRNMTVKEIRGTSKRFGYHSVKLPDEPSDDKQITVEIFYDVKFGRTVRRGSEFFTDFTYTKESMVPEVKLKLVALAKLAKLRNCVGNQIITAVVRYPTRTRNSLGEAPTSH